jgi:hypothetical protein
MEAQAREFLASATKAQIIARRDALYDAKRELKDRDMRRLSSNLIRIMDAEIVARASLANVERTRLALAS